MVKNVMIEKEYVKMALLTDIDIASNATLKPINEIAQKLNIDEEDIVLFGDSKAKIKLSALNTSSQQVEGKLILVTAMTPTSVGEGKTTTSVGLADALSAIGEKTALALREPSLGPVFGMKGGACGGGYAQVIPMEDINLHFTGDFHAISAANNLLAAMIDNHIHHGNTLRIDSRRITWKRVVDMNDRQLRHIVSGLHGKSNGVPREDGFDITVASEIMAILCLASSLHDLKIRLGNIIIGYNMEGQPVTASDLKVEGALTALLKHAILPNLVQTLEHTPAFIHGGPFANIAHGCNSLIATRMALSHADYVVTEAGFGADLGAEKFLNIKCRIGELKPSAVVVVATVRALKLHGGINKNALSDENVEAVLNGLPNLEKHLDTIQTIYGLPCVVGINKFPTDTEDELQAVMSACEKKGVPVALSDAWAKGGQGAIDLAKEVVALSQHDSALHFAYDLNDDIATKITHIATKVYGAKSVTFSIEAKREIKKLESLGLGQLPICMAKTQYSFSDNPKLLGAPSDFNITIRAIKVSAGAGFIVALTGDIMTMPGLPKVPAAENIDVDELGNITGLF